RHREERRREQQERRRQEDRANTIAAGVVLGALAINSMASCAAEQQRNQVQDPPAIEQTTDGVEYGR
ncbi:MAG: hypothetical protein HY925_06105, partial [Elusimicrobia bacterium]|nr:hypothetical protein [Elusimicrobiota bacterium]